MKKSLRKSLALMRKHAKANGDCPHGEVIIAHNTKRLNKFIVRAIEPLEETANE